MSEVNFRGPMFDGRANLAVHNFIEHAKKEIATEGQHEVLQRLDSSIRVNHHNYTGHIQVDRLGDDFSVNDSGIVYGPWLEGTGSRNRTTRFKGYSSFRKARVQLEAKAGGMAERILPPYLREMQ
jgi:hypothetical protein